MTKIARMVVLAFAFILLGTGCSKHVAKTISSHPILIEPNLEVANVRKGMSREEVESAIGAPQKKDKTTSFYKGMWVRFDTNGIVFNVKCVNGFEGLTKEGIGIGSTREELTGTYGPPDEDKHFKDGEDLWYAGISINFWVQRGKVTSFIVHF